MTSLVAAYSLYIQKISTSHESTDGSKLSQIPPLLICWSLNASHPLFYHSALCTPEKVIKPCVYTLFKKMRSVDSDSPLCCCT